METNEQTSEGPALIGRVKAIEYLGVSTRTVDRWAKEGILERGDVGQRAGTWFTLESVQRAKRELVDPPAGAVVEPVEA